jgi:hypothetical protein
MPPPDLLSRSLYVTSGKGHGCLLKVRLSPPASKLSYRGDAVDDSPQLTVLTVVILENRDASFWP